MRGYVHVIKQDTVKPDILYAGTEFGLWISIDGGAHWAQFKGGDMPDRRGARHRIPGSRRLARARDARPRHLDRRRPDAAARARWQDARQRSRVPRDATDPAAHQRVRRLGRRRCELHRPQSAQSAPRSLLPEEPPSVRQAQDRRARRQGRAHRHDPGERAPRHQPRDMVDARQAAARAAGRADRVQFDAGSARAARHVHRAPDQGQGRLRDQDRRRPRPPRDVLGRRPPRAVRRRDEGARRCSAR